MPFSASSVLRAETSVSSSGYVSSSRPFFIPSQVSRSTVRLFVVLLFAILMT